MLEFLAIMAAVNTLLLALILLKMAANDEE